MLDNLCLRSSEVSFLFYFHGSLPRICVNTSFLFLMRAYKHPHDRKMSELSMDKVKLSRPQLQGELGTFVN